MLGKQVNDIASSEYLFSYHKTKNTPAPYFNLDEEFTLQQAIKAVIKKQLVKSAHDISDGGLFINLLESSIHGNLGFEIKTNASLRKDAYLFGEAQGRAVISISSDNKTAFEMELKNSNVLFEEIGIVKGKEIIIDNAKLGTVSEYENAYNTSIESKLN